MSQILLRRLSAHSHAVLVCRHLGSAGGASRCYSSGGERRRAAAQEDESRAVRVSVWWDFENCHIPNGINVCRVAPRVAAALRAAGIRGPISITAFGDVLQLARSAQEALVATGVSISHVPSSGKNSSDRSFMADLVYWIAQNPPPVHFFLISGDKDFANMLHRLRMSNYNVLLACPSHASNVLCSAATIMWPWDALVKGEDFSPKRFNHPPDGSLASWYGQYKGALDDPFLEPIEVQAAPRRCEITSASMHGSVPKHVITAIQEAISSSPEGMSLSVLRGELRKNNIHLGTDFFGHKKFSSLIQSMPDIVKFIAPPPGADQLYVTSVNKRLVLPGEPSSKTELSSKTQSSAQCNVKEDNLIEAEHPSFQSIDGKRKLIEGINENPPTLALSSSPSDAASEDLKECPTVEVNPISESSGNHRELDERTTPETPSISESSGNHREPDERPTPETPSSSVLENAGDKYGLFKRIWILWNGPENAKHENSQNDANARISAGVVDELQTPLQEHNADNGRDLERLNKNSLSSGSDGTAAASSSSSILSDDDHSEKIKRNTSLLDNSEQNSEPASLPLRKSDDKDDTSKMSKGLFSWASNWWRFGKSDTDDSATKQNAVDETVIDSTKEAESPSTSDSVSEQQMASVIFSKPSFWDIMEQQLSKPFGSELVSKAKTREELVYGLKKIGCWPLKGLLDKDLHQLVHLLISEKKWIKESPSRRFPFCVTLPHKRTCVPSNSSKQNDLSSIFSNVKPLQQGKYANGNSKTNRLLSREEILSDCHKLLKELLSQYEYGFNISIFKHRFAKKHGYELDHQKVGYTDLESLLQSMPDVRVKFPRVLPAENGNKQGNQNNGDIWEELGPVSATAEITAGADKEMCYCPPTPSDDEFSDNDSPADQQPRRDAEQSSLLQIIDSWNSRKDGGSRNKPGDIDGLVDCSKGRPSNIDNVTFGNAQRPARLSRKQYLFVSDSEEGQGKDQLVESVLGSLQKARANLHS